MKLLSNLVRLHKSGLPVGIYSVCSSHPWVLQACMRTAAASGGYALIEATSNQVNQDGGYTGMAPADYVRAVHQLAAAASLPTDRVLLGGDHLGPNCWQSLPAQTALQRAAVLVDQYVAAGFRKIHLDCSMACAAEPKALGDELIAERAAALCEVSEDSWRRVGGPPPVYIIGSEVPVPGGTQESLDELAVTTPQAALATLEAHRLAFCRQGLQDAWERVIGLVVQPGVEFNHHQVIDYQPGKAAALSRSIERVPGLVFEAHSTDYQTPRALAELVRDHFAILKVGPAVTFALREALWSLAAIATELGLESGAALKQTLLHAMRRDTRHWASYYRDPSREQLDLQFSLSDRIRYYWSSPTATGACSRLLEELRAAGIPATLLSQYLPHQYAAVREGRTIDDPHELVIEAIMNVLRDYAMACDPNKILNGALLSGDLQ